MEPPIWLQSLFFKALLGSKLALILNSFIPIAGYGCWFLGRYSLGCTCVSAAVVHPPFLANLKGTMIHPWIAGCPYHIILRQFLCTRLCWLQFWVWCWQTTWQSPVLIARGWVWGWGFVGNVTTWCHLWLSLFMGSQLFFKRCAHLEMVELKQSPGHDQIPLRLPDLTGECEPMRTTTIIWHQQMVTDVLVAMANCDGAIPRGLAIPLPS